MGFFLECYYYWGGGGAPTEREPQARKLGREPKVGLRADLHNQEYSNDKLMCKSIITSVSTRLQKQTFSRRG